MEIPIFRKSDWQQEWLAKNKTYRSKEYREPLCECEFCWGCFFLFFCSDSKTWHNASSSYANSCVYMCLKFSFILRIISWASFLLFHQNSTEACINFKETFTEKIYWMQNEIPCFKERLILEEVVF